MIVLDATVAVKLVTREPGADAALGRVLQDGDRVAPDWMRLEVASALSKKVLHDRLDRDMVPGALAALDRFMTGWMPAVDLVPAALDLSMHIRHAVYDCLYLALAQQTNATFVTHDAKFVAAINAAGVRGDIDLLR